MQTGTIYRLVVDGKYIDYFFTLKHAKRAAKVFEDQGQVVQIITE